MESLRKRSPTPKLFMHPTDAAKEGVIEGDWASLKTTTGEVRAKISVQPSRKEGHIRVPHGWWYPEMRGEAQLAGVFISSDAVLCPDDPEVLDYEQGIPHFTGFPGRIDKLQAEPAGMSVGSGGLNIARRGVAERLRHRLIQRFRDHGTRQIAQAIR